MPISKSFLLYGKTADSVMPPAVELPGLLKINPQYPDLQIHRKL